MSIQLGRNLKIFLTTNLSSAGAVLATGFTPENTRELILVADSLDFSQSKSYEYINAHNQIDPNSQLEIRARPSLELGSLNFRTALNTSNSGPFDARLWNALVNELRYPLGAWTLAQDFHTLRLVRQTQKTVAFGMVVLADGVAYLFDGVRVNSVALELGQDSVASSNWTCVFDKYRVLPAAYTQSSGIATFSGGLTGTATLENHANYTWAGGKLARVTFAKQGGLDPVDVASLDLSLSVSNTQNYIPNLGIDRTELDQYYTDAGAALLEGTLTAYSRGQGTPSYNLLQELRSHASDPYSTALYDVQIQLFTGTQSKLCDIQLYNTSLLSTTSAGNVLTDNFSFKVVDGVQAQNCFIKFYT